MPNASQDDLQPSHDFNNALISAHHRTDANNASFERESVCHSQSGTRVRPWKRDSHFVNALTSPNKIRFYTCITSFLHFMEK